MTESKSLKPIYKVVRVEDGKYYSIYIGTKLYLKNLSTTIDSDILKARQLIYSIGNVTICNLPLGIFTYGNLEEAKDAYLHDSFELLYDHSLPLAILECYTIGRDDPSSNIRSILPVREVFRLEPDIKPKFSIGQEVMCYGRACIVESVEKHTDSSPPKYLYNISCKESKIRAYEDTLRSIRWKDITKQCSINFITYPNASIHINYLHTTIATYNPTTNSFDFQPLFRISRSMGTTHSFRIYVAEHD
jgi:hypothetical protein